MKIKFQRYGFTLIELLVVISVIALLLSILTPSLRKAREQVRQVVCGTNLHTIGQGIAIYASEHDDKLVSGDFSIPWAVWGDEGGECGYKEVNLGYLLTSGTLPVPDDEDNVFFCPSMTPGTALNAMGEEYFDYETFDSCWQDQTYPAPVNYMFNTALDGFGNSLLTGSWAILSHQNRIQYLLADGSSQSFKVRALVYNPSVGPELLQEVCQRTGVNFPSLMLHQWLAKGSVDLDEAKTYLADPAGWMNTYASSLTVETASTIRLSKVANTSLASDVVGAWDALGRGGTPPQPG